MAIRSSVLAWRIPGTEEGGGLPSMGSHRVWHDWSDLAAAYVRWMLSQSFFAPGFLFQRYTCEGHWYGRGQHSTVWLYHGLSILLLLVMFLGAQVYACPMCASKDGTASMHMLCFSRHHQAVFQSHHPSTLPSAIHEDSSCFVHACSCPTLCDPMDCSLPGSSVPGTFQQEY